MVGRTTEQYIQAGVAAFHLEDQVVNKRCGHLKNKELVNEEVYLSRIKAAANARSKSGGDIVIIARTDSLQSLGYEAAVSRLKAAIAVGADVAFLEGFITIEQGRRVCAELAPTPVLLNMVAGGVTPKMSVAEAKEMGFKIMIYPAFAVEPVYAAVAAVAKELKETGDLKSNDDFKWKGPKELFEVCGLNESIEFDIAAGGKLYSNGV
jgi:2-methylisocitrate lyase-like PEP mutase family enzyme